MLGKLKDAATRCMQRAVDAPKCVCGRGSAQTPLGELTALPRPFSWIWGNGNVKGWRGKEAEEEEKEGMEREKGGMEIGIG